MNILVLNAGSSSLKFEVFSAPKKGMKKGKMADKKNGGVRSVYAGNIERIGVEKNKIRNHEQAVKKMFDDLKEQNLLTQILLIGHRVVHGGSLYSQPAIITKKVEKDIAALASLAPLHNPPNLATIRAAKKQLPHNKHGIHIKHVAVFDTAFHAEMPQLAQLYAIPLHVQKNLHIKRYGFHGTSHKYVSEAARALLGPQKTKYTISCHLGNGSSITAIKNGKSVDTSMGFTPLEGIPMGTRSGDIDPALIFFLQDKGLKSADIKHMLEKESGLLGVSGISSDVRTLLAHTKKGSAGTREAAMLALNLFAYRIAKYIAGYTAVLRGLDCLIFTAGIGENAWYLRRDICAALAHLGVRLDQKKNRAATDQTKSTKISSARSTVTVLVIPTDEEKQIAIEALHAVAA